MLGSVIVPGTRGWPRLPAGGTPGGSEQATAPGWRLRCTPLRACAPRGNPRTTTSGCAAASTSG